METERYIAQQSPPRRVKRWAPRTKTGCRVCRKRRVKCDETRPGCKNCMRVGRNCPGYIGDSVLPTSKIETTTMPSMILSLPQFDGSKDSRELLSLIQHLIEKQGDSGMYRNRIHDALYCVASQCTKYLPCRSGHNIALDTAMSCMVGGLQELFKSARKESSRTESEVTMLLNPSSHVTRSYIAAIAALRCALDNRRLSSTPELLLATVLICCFESLRDESEERLHWHMYGLSKIFEHRGIPEMGDSMEYTLTLSCLPIMILGCYFSNSACFLSESKWANVFDRLRVSVDTARHRWFVDNWRLYAQTATLLADCSRFIFKSDSTVSSWDSERRHLLERIDSVEQICIWQRDEKVGCISGGDPKANLFSLYEKLGSDRESRTRPTLHFLGIYPQNLLPCYLVRVALGSDNALASVKSALALATRLELFSKELPPEEFEYGSDLKLTLAATLSTADEWLNFALEEEVNAAQGLPRAVNAYLWGRWLKRAGIKARDR